MAFSATALSNDIGGLPGRGIYTYVTSADSMATVAGSTYFNNQTNLQNFTAGDLIFCRCSDGDMWLKIGTVTATSGAITTQPTSGFGPWNGVIGSASASITVPGITELGTGTATAYVLGAVPYAGARVVVTQTGTATGGITVVTSSAGCTVDAAGDRTVTFTGKTHNVELLGVSASRWVIVNNNGVTYS